MCFPLCLKVGVRKILLTAGAWRQTKALKTIWTQIKTNTARTPGGVFYCKIISQKFIVGSGLVIKKDSVLAAMM